MVLFILTFLLMNLVFQMTSFGQWGSKSSQKVKVVYRNTRFYLPWDKTVHETIIKMSLENNTRLNHMKFPFLQVKTVVYLGRPNTFPDNDSSVFWHNGKCQTCISFQV